MGGLEILDVVIGLVFIYLVLSLICTAMNETILNVLGKLRAATLRRCIKQMLSPTTGKDGQDTTALGEAFYKHPLVRSLGRGHLDDKSRWARFTNRFRDPSYIPGHVFADVLLDLLRHSERKQTSETQVDEEPPKDVWKAVKAGVDNYAGATDLGTALRPILERVGTDIDKARKALEQWFDDVGERCRGWYARRMMRWTFLWALILTLLVNADTLELTQKLWRDSATRQRVVSLAEEAAKDAAQQDEADDTERAVEDGDDSETEPAEPGDGNQPEAGAQGPASDASDDAEPAVEGDEGAQTQPAGPEDDDAGSDAAEGAATKYYKELEKLNLLGWPQDPDEPEVWVDWGALKSWRKILGLLITIVLVSLGAPFWFDVLQRFVNLRTRIAAAKKDEGKAKGAQVKPKA